MHTFTDPTHETSEDGRFWSTVNSLEATPLVMTAMDWTFWGKSLELAALRAWHDLGIVRDHEMGYVDDADHRVTASFFGRQATNIDRVRYLMGAMPGTSGDDIERDIFGEARSGVVDPERDVSTLAVLRGFPRSIRRHGGEVAQLRADNHRWWRHRIDDPTSGGSAAKRLLEARFRFEDAQHLHIRGRSLLQGLGSQVYQIAESVGRGDLISALVSGVGDMEETLVVDDLWRVAHDEMSLDAFLVAHGYHGYGEGNISGASWRERPDQVTRLLASYADVDESQRPRTRSLAARSARDLAHAELMAALPAPKRPIARWLSRKTVELTRDVEVSKAAFLMTIDVARAASRELGEQFRARGVVDVADDVLHLTVDEAAEGRVDDVRGLVEFRRECHRNHLAVRPPDSWIGNPEPLPAAVADRGAAIVGVGGSPGVVEGVARVVDDPMTDEPPGPGEILVCAMSDPSWAPMFMMAAAVVIDVGGVSSHGAIVARELGVPCVINTRTGTAAINTGDLLRVDGDSGSVTILDRTRTEATPA